MKNLQSILSLVLILLSLTVYADGTDAKKLTLKYALNTFVDAFSHGKSAAFTELLDEHVRMTTSRGSTTLTFKKAEIVYMMKSEAGIEQNCRTTSSIIESLPGMVKMKISMAYNSFDKNHYVTLKQTNKGWRITNIATIFE